MTEPLMPAPDAGDESILDRLHHESRRFIAASPEIDVEQTLDAIRRWAASFWESLDRGDQRDFADGSTERTFAAGARLMQEGETADHVLVILEGRAIILVHEPGGAEAGVAEREVARRGPGDLIGEHAVQHPGVRSATVVAQTQIRALDMKAEDFSEFLATHSSVARPQPRTI